jgi:hypothetical protein
MKVAIAQNLIFAGMLFSSWFLVLFQGRMPLELLCVSNNVGHHCHDLQTQIISCKGVCDSVKYGLPVL